MQADSLSSEPPGKPKNTEVGSPSLFQGNLPHPEIELGSPALQVDSLPTDLFGKPSVVLLLVLVVCRLPLLSEPHSSHRKSKIQFPSQLSKSLVWQRKWEWWDLPGRPVVKIP